MANYHPLMYYAAQLVMGGGSPKMKLIVVESAFASNDQYTQPENVTFARRVCRYIALQGHAPFASHLLYTQADILDDDVSEEREHGIAAGLAWAEHADEIWVCLRSGELASRGVRAAIEHHTYNGYSFRVMYFTKEGDFLYESPDQLTLDSAMDAR